MTNVIQFSPKTALTPVEEKTWCILQSKEEDADVLAMTFDVSAQTIRNIKQLKTARSIRMVGAMKKAGVEAWVWPVAARFTEDEVRQIRKSKATSQALGKVWGVSASTIRMIKTGQTYVGA